MQVNFYHLRYSFLAVKINAMNLLNTKQVAGKLNISTIRVRQLIQEGRLKAQLVGRDYVIDESDLKLVQERKTGRPPAVSQTDKK